MTGDEGGGGASEQSGRRKLAERAIRVLGLAVLGSRAGRLDACREGAGGSESSGDVPWRSSATEACNAPRCPYCWRRRRRRRSGSDWVPGERKECDSTGRRGERGFRGGQRLSRAGLISGTHAPKPEAILLKSRRTVPDTLWDMPRAPAHFIHRGSATEQSGQPGPFEPGCQVI